jgi:hypothetical protein
VYHQTDTVRARFESGTSGVVLGGLGVKYELNSRSGVRVDYRFHAGSDPSTVELNWDPRTIVSGGATFVFAGTPALQVTNSPNVQASLSLTQTTPDVQVASSDGMRRMSQLSVGTSIDFHRRLRPRKRAGRQRRRPQPPDAVSGTRRKSGKRIFILAPWRDRNPRRERRGTFRQVKRSRRFPGRPSRSESTWMFGDGSAFLNQVLPQFPAAIAINSRITPLDSTLTSASISRSRSLSFGARVSRKLTRRLRAEFAVDSTGGSLSVSDGALAGIEATRASFVPVWNGIIASGQGLFTNGNVAATTDLVNDVSNRQTSLTGALEIHLWDTPKLVTYATVAEASCCAPTLCLRPPSPAWSSSASSALRNSPTGTSSVCTTTPTPVCRCSWLASG